MTSRVTITNENGAMVRVIVLDENATEIREESIDLAAGSSVTVSLDDRRAAVRVEAG